ncbi:MAG: polysaccharide biosynthesis/export family protein, partial [Candidatus Binatia bacterium]
MKRYTAGLRIALALVSSLAIVGCSGSLRSNTRPVAAATPAPSVETSESVSQSSAPAVAPDQGQPVAATFEDRNARAGIQRLGSLAAERERSRTSRLARLGAGDIVRITVFELDDLNRTVRIARSGEITLPLIGRVRAAGLTETELAAEIGERLSKDYLQNAQVDVFISEHRSQLVAVTGAVNRPGLYPLTSRQAAILDLLSRAGGLATNAGPNLELIPAESAGASEALQRAGRGEADPAAAGKGIPIDLAELMRGSNQMLTNFRVAPGDVLFVPKAGTFTVEGWVEYPGAYPVSRGATARSAIISAGGASFAADLSSIQLLRAVPGAQASRQVQVLDLRRGQDVAGENPPIAAGDVVRVPADPIRLPPWLLFAIVRGVVRMGASVII